MTLFKLAFGLLIIVEVVKFSFISRRGFKSVKVASKSDSSRPLNTSAWLYIEPYWEKLEEKRYLFEVRAAYS